MGSNLQGLRYLPKEPQAQAWGDTGTHARIKLNNKIY